MCHNIVIFGRLFILWTFVLENVNYQLLIDKNSWQLFFCQLTDLFHHILLMHDMF